MFGSHMSRPLVNDQIIHCSSEEGIAAVTSCCVWRIHMTAGRALHSFCSLIRTLTRQARWTSSYSLFTAYHLQFTIYRLPDGRLCFRVINTCDIEGLLTRFAVSSSTSGAAHE